MARQKIARRLTTIVSIDVAGYSRLMEADEAGTLEQLKAHREVIDPEIDEHGGRIVGTAGDGLLVEFPSVADAVTCAVDVQSTLAVRNAEFAENRRMEFRIGVNLGDVMIEGDDIFGNGVNVAARLQALAEPGGVCISRPVYDQARHSLDLAYEDLGPQEVKNITEPVHAYRVLTGSKSRGEASRATEMPALQLPDKPSIAVLPFENMSGDPEQEYFADGIVDDIITELSRFRLLFVTARNSTFTYKGQAVDVKQVARDLGVRYVVEGSVRKAGNRVRLTVQLIDAATGNHVWAERYDRELEDVFAVQDEITENIVATIEPQFLTAEMRRIRRKHEKNLDAWDHFIRAYWHLARFTREDVAEAQRLARRAIELDPHGASQFNVLSVTHVMAAIYGWEESRDQSLRDARVAAERAVALDGNDAMSARTMGLVNMYSRRHDDAVRDFKHAIELCPTEAENHALLGNVLGFTGDYEGAVKHVEKAIRFSPRDSFLATWYNSLAMTATMTGRDEEAIEWARRAIQANPRLPGGYRSLAASFGHLGRTDDARAALEKLLKLVPELTIAQARENLPIKHEADLEHYLDGLRKAGLPE